MDMYSRKYIRSPVAMAERGMPVISNTVTPSPRGEEAGVYLPPDYKGMAFSGNGRGSPLQKNDEYPETKIPPPEEASTPWQEDSLAITVEEESLEPTASEPEECSAPEEPETVSQSKEAEQVLPPAEEPMSPPTPATAPTPPLLTPELLRSLTLEDLLLFWMLLLLTTANPDDQLYLLLGLLLIQR
ncbi:MAG: hypothetical protein J6R82_04790 [Clostridia bacterium]|nr:hypothetical protein [Clostridia bacterium]